MDLRQFEYLVAVAEEGSFTRAAARVHISQSGVSAQIRDLERELGQGLFDRTSRSVRLTEVGAAVLPYARAALEAATGARQVIDDLAGLVRGKVSVGMVAGCSLPPLAALLADFHHLHPGVVIALTEARSDQLIEALRQGQLDLALIGTNGDPLDGLHRHVVLDDVLVALVNATNPLARRKSLAVTALRGEPLTCLPKGTGARQAFDDACAAADFAPRVAFEASALSMVIGLASLGLGVGVVPASSAALAEHTVQMVPIVRPQIHSRLELAWPDRRATHPAADALIEHADQFIAKLEDVVP